MSGDFKRRSRAEVKKEEAENIQQQEAANEASEPVEAPLLEAPIEAPSEEAAAFNPEALLAELEQLGEAGLGALLGAQGPKTFRSGDIVKGAITRIEDENLFIDLGGKSEGVLSRVESDLEAPRLGLVIEARVIRADSRGIRLARKLSNEGGYEALQSAFELGMPVEIKITGKNKHSI